ncbi:hypothetical protein AB833_02285 [Chromatiales bacterium (ex Bugula neritina AB1)]|nr:hypothetical protein AB833_02285 [Chromatiales bacterium (ex Bugula neritina AB1)]
MKSEDSTIFELDLSADEVEDFSPPLHAKVEDELSRAGKKVSRWVLIGAETARQAALMRNTYKAVARIAAERRAALSEKHIEGLVDLYLEGEQRAEIDNAIERDNAQMRARYLKETPAYTAAEIRQHCNAAPTNPSEPASRWKREKRVFAIRFKGGDLFPHYQFSDGEPLPVIRKVLKLLPAGMTPWQIAFWFESGNGWLDGRAPQDSLNDPQALTEAARNMADSAIG